MKKQISYPFILIIFGILFFILNYYTPLFCDDWHYCFIFGSQEPIDSILDIFKSQYIHYFNQNGRFTPHFFVQLFDGILGKTSFNIINTLFFIAFLHLINKTISPNKNLYYIFTSITVILLLFFLPVFGTNLLWMSGACNYLWTGVFLLAFNLLLSKNIHNKLLYPLLFIFGLLTGWTHEAMVIGLSVGYIVFYAINKKEITNSRIWLLVGFFIGTLLLVISPGNMHRALGENEFSLTLFFQGSFRALIEFLNLRIFFIFILLFLTLIKNKYIFVKDNIIIVVALFISFIFLWMIKRITAHSCFGIEFFSLILMLRIVNIQILKSNYYSPHLFHVLNVISIVFFIYISTLCVKNYSIYKSIEKQITLENKEIIITDQLIIKNPLTNRFIFSDSYCNFENFEQEWIRNYYRKEKLLFIYKLLQESINEIETKQIDHYYTTKQLSYYIKKIDQQTSINKIYYTLEETNFNELPFHISLIAPYLDRYNIMKVEAQFRILNINDKNYLLIEKNNAVKDRIKDIIIN